MFKLHGGCNSNRDRIIDLLHASERSTFQFMNKNDTISILITFICLLVLATSSGKLNADDAELDKASQPMYSSEAGEQASVEEEPAISFLRTLEKKNSETKSLQAEFDQVRIDRTLFEEVKSQGRFWYQAPGSFRADYEATDGKSINTTIWMTKGKVVSYTPELEQVEVIRQDASDDAPVNQMLLAFGVETEKILSQFEVVVDEEKSTDDRIAIQFKSRKPELTMGYETIVVTFDREKVEPKEILLSNEGEELRLQLNKTKINPSIKDDVFEMTWPDDVDVLEY